MKLKIKLIKLICKYIKLKFLSTQIITYRFKDFLQLSKESLVTSDRSRLLTHFCGTKNNDMYFS